MAARLRSLRLQLLVAMAVTAVAGLVGAYFVIGTIEHAEERAIIRNDAAEAARAVAIEAEGGAGRERFRLDQALLGDDQLLVFRNGRRVFAGPARTSELTATATSFFPGGRAVVVAHANEDPRLSVELTLALAAVVLLAIGATIGTAALMARTVQEPIERAIVAADLVAAGDLSARIGSVGTEEFARLAGAFDGMANRLESADRDQRRLLADVAHEIATPVNAITGLAGALADGSARTKAERAEAAELISHESARLSTLIADLRQLTRLDLLDTVRTERIDIGDICHELARQLQPAASAGGVSLSVDAGSLPAVADKRLLETVLVNLLTNAIRYTPAGGKVELSARRTRRHVVISVRDTGIGIRPEHRERIFDRLYRVDEARDRVSGGSGLGLAIAQRAARSLGGRIELDSEPGRGSEFRLVLPRKTARPTGRAAVARDQARDGGSVHGSRRSGP
jgi:signal transduction histidine kinase